MRKPLIPIMVVTLTALSAYAAKIETSKLKQLADIKITTYNHQLRTTLNSNIELGILKRNLEGCASVAQNMKIQNGTGGWKIERTSLKFRNPENAPDQWEKGQLNAFQRAIDNGKPIDKLSVERLTSVGPKKVVYKYMKAIQTEAICLNCHGSKLTETVQQNLNKAFPQDQATGYAVGDLMGAYVLTKVVNSK